MCLAKWSSSRIRCSQKRRCQTPRSFLHIRRSDKRSPGSIAWAKADLINRQRVEKSASTVGSAQAVQMIRKDHDGVGVERALGAYRPEGFPKWVDRAGQETPPPFEQGYGEKVGCARYSDSDIVGHGA